MSTEQKHIGLTNAQAQHVSSSVDPVLLAEGFELLRQEKEHTFKQSFHHHWRALLWGSVLSLALVMDGYDGSIAGSFYALPSFTKFFGSYAGLSKTGQPTYILDANIMSAIGFVGIPGGFLGLWLCGYCQERFGSRPTYFWGMFSCICVTFLFVFAQNLTMILVAQAIAAACWALFNTLSAAYAIEICPIQLRGLATSFISMCWGFGGFLASGVNKGLSTVDTYDTPWTWRVGYGLQWVWPAILIVVVYFAPESPWWLVRKGRVEEAKKVLRRTATPGYWDTRNIDAYIAVIQHTHEVETAEAEESRFRDLWRGTNLRRTEIQMGLWATQVWSGTAMTSLATVFFQSAGLSTSMAFTLNVVITSGNIIGCAIEFIAMRYFSRRTLILNGLIVLACCLFAMGVAGSVPNQDSLGCYVVIGLAAAIINLWYHATIGPISYTMAAEMPATNLRVKSVAWGRAFYSINYNVTNQLQIRFIKTKEAGGWGWATKTAFFWLGGNLGVTLWAFFRLPETSGLTFLELDVLFANKISARKFKKVVVHDETVDAANDKLAAGQHIEDSNEKQDLAEIEQARPTATLT